MKKSISEKMMIKAIQNNSPQKNEYLQKLYSKYIPLIKSMASSLNDKYEDFMQEAFIVLLQTIESVREAEIDHNFRISMIYKMRLKNLKYGFVKDAIISSPYTLTVYEIKNSRKIMRTVSISNNDLMAQFDLMDEHIFGPGRDHVKTDEIYEFVYNFLSNETEGWQRDYALMRMNGYSHKECEKGAGISKQSWFKARKEILKKLRKSFNNSPLAFNYEL